MTALYNELDPFAAQWLRNLIQAGHIAPGDVAECSIEDLTPDDVRGYTQFHAFAGVGVWSYALRLAGWPDDRPVWTGSCPCQPFSAAGKGGGFADERHLWPAWFHLVSQCRPAIVLGEQVGSKDASVWIDLVQDDLEAVGYAFGAVPFPAASVGAPHIRQRLWFAGERLADADDARSQGRQEPGRERAAERLAGQGGVAGGLGQPDIDGREPGLAGSAAVGHRGSADAASGAVGLADANLGAGRQGRQEPRRSHPGSYAVEGSGPGRDGGAGRPGPTNGFWRDPDWLFCRDGKWRPVESGTFPLAHGAPQRVGRLRAYGNAIVAEAAQAFIESYLEIERVRLKDPSAGSGQGVFG